MDKSDLWSALAAPLHAGTISWRQDGRAIERDGRWYARFVAYVDANTVRERLDAVVPGEWDLTLDLLPPLAGRDEDEGAGASFKARLQILGVIREDVGTGRDYKAAATDAFKRAAVRFGIGHELYAMEPNWVQVEGEGRQSRALEDPQAAYDRRATRRGPERVERAGRSAERVAERPATVERGGGSDAAATVVAPEPAPALAGSTLDAEHASCPKCGGRMWDNRLTKRNPKAPDFKCRDRACDGVIWPPRGNGSGAPAADVPEPQPEEEAAPTPRRGKRARTAEPAAVAAAADEMVLDSSPLGASDDDDLPF